MANNVRSKPRPSSKRGPKAGTKPGVRSKPKIKPKIKRKSKLKSKPKPKPKPVSKTRSSSKRAKPPTLAGFQRRALRARANPLKALVQVGEAGLSPGLMRALDAALLKHELVKVRMHEPEDKKAAAATLAQRSRAALCGLVGHTVILYRPNPDEPVIELPKR
jgi:RNA-binding protein